MKKIFFALSFSFSFLLLNAQLPEKVKAQQEPQTIAGAETLLKTNWDQFGIYARYTPDNQVLGCWSTALAQILYYHRLQPTGEVDYTCTKGYVIRDTLSKFHFNWEAFAPELEEASHPDAIEAVARYSYLTAAAVRKDFGTGRYMQAVNPAGQLARHFTCEAEFYACFTGEVPLPKEQMEMIVKNENIKHVVGENGIKTMIRHELTQKRPVYFHFGNFTTYGHSTVIDGYSEKTGVFMVHINYGSGGVRTGWYDLFKSIDVADDIKLRAFVTIKPGVEKK